jgi:hypothetical protein
MRYKFIILVLIIFSVLHGYSQSFDVRRIFNSGATFGVEYLMPSELNDSVDFQLTKHKVQFVKVLRTKEVDIEKFDMKQHNAKANQLFLGSKFSISKPSFSRDDYLKKQYKGEVELIYITASKRRGVWFHSVNINAEENSMTFPDDVSPNFRANSIYIHAKNLKFVPFIGPGISVTQGKFYFLPIFGFGAKLNKKITAELIVPVHVKIKYDFKQKAEVELACAYSGIHTVYREGSYWRGNDGLNLRQLKIHMGISASFNKHYRIKTEIGYAFLQELNAISYDFSQKMASMPFVNFSLNYNFGNSILYKFFNEEKSKKFKKINN